MVHVDVSSEVERLFDDSSLVSDREPTAIILMGGVAAGKTTLRRERYSRGFVLIDATEMFHHMSQGDATLDFPDAFLAPLEMIGPIVARRAIAERRSIVTEIIGAEYEPVKELISSLKSAGYLVDIVHVTCDLEESFRCAANRGDNISSYYAERFQRQWITDACRQAAP